MEHEVYYAQTDIPAGQLISGDMVQKEIVQTELMIASSSMLRIWEVWLPAYRSSGNATYEGIYWSGVPGSARW